MRVLGFAFLVLTPSIFGDTVKSVTVLGAAAPVDLKTQVGREYDAEAIEKDVRHLWSTGRFSDIRVERSEQNDGLAVVFRVTEIQTQPLHEIRIQPSTYGLELSLPEGTPIDHMRAFRIAGQARDELRTQGFPNAQVSYKLVPVIGGPARGQQVDLQLTAQPGVHVRVKRLDFTGDTALDPDQLRGGLVSLRTRRLIPPLPGIWGGWQLFPAYSPEAVQADLARVQSLYLSKGYLDAKIRLDEVDIRQSEADVTVRIDAGPQYRTRRATIDGNDTAAASPGAFCSDLFASRREAQQQGILDFSAKIDARRIEIPDEPDSLVDLSAVVDRGKPYRIGRIDFVGNRHYSEAMLRRNLLLDEGALLDELLLRKSVARVNQGARFEPIRERDVAVRTDPARGVADIAFHLREQKRNAWKVSGPVGPASFAGSLDASVRSRLPSWGTGLFELSTYTASISVYAFAPPLARLLSIVPKWPVFPVLSLQRPFLPGEGWTSGITIAPQLGWPALSAGYAVTQIQQRLLPLLSGDRGMVSELPVTIETSRGEARMFCEPPPPKLVPLRTGAALAVRFLGVLAGL